MCVFLMYFLSNLYLYNTVLSVLFCVNKDIIKILLLLLLFGYFVLYIGNMLSP